MAASSTLSEAIAGLFEEHLPELVGDAIARGVCDEAFEEAAKTAVENVDVGEAIGSDALEDLVRDAVCECDLDGLLSKAIKRGDVDICGCIGSYLEDNPETITDRADEYLKAAFAGSWADHLSLHNDEQEELARRYLALSDRVANLAQIVRETHERDSSLWGRIRFLCTGR